MDLLEKLLLPSPVETLATFPQWEERHRRAIQEAKTPIEQALMAGHSVDRLGYAFASGQQVAISAILGGNQAGLAALCVAEDAGSDAADLQSHTKEGLLYGKKSSVMLGPAARVLWVVAREATQGSESGRFRLVRIKVPKANLEVRRLKSSEMMPEIPHADIFFEGVDVMDEEILPGDGIEHYLKPLKTAEDMYVHAAMLGWYAHILANAEAPAAMQEEMLVYVQALRALAAMPLSSATMQLSLAGTLTRIRAFLEFPGAFWDDVDTLIRERWLRDRPLLLAASRHQNARREAAWKKIHTAPKS